MGHKLKNGYVLDEAEIEARAAEWESDTWEGCLTPIPIGRPRLREEEESVVVTFRLPRSSVEAVEFASERCGLTRSEFYRRTVERELEVVAATS